MTNKKREGHHVSMNFKIAMIAVFFFFLLFELHSPVFKPAATGYAPRSLGHYDKVDMTSGCRCLDGTYVVYSTDAQCDCFDPVYNDIITIDRLA